MRKGSLSSLLLVMAVHRKSLPNPPTQYLAQDMAGEQKVGAWESAISKVITIY